MKTFTIRTTVIDNDLVYIPDDETGNYAESDIQEFRFDYQRPSEDEIAEITGRTLTGASSPQNADDAMKMSGDILQNIILHSVRQWNIVDDLGRFVPINSHMISSLPLNIIAEIAHKIFGGVNENRYASPRFIRPAPIV